VQILTGCPGMATSAIPDTARAAITTNATTAGATTAGEGTRTTPDATAHRPAGCHHAG
jgi:hypothetical protein